MENMTCMLLILLLEPAKAKETGLEEKNFNFF
jgi:hypothetical protein